MKENVLTPEEEIEFKKWWNEDETAKLWRAKYEETMGMAPMGGPSKSDCMFKVQWKKGWRPDPDSDDLVAWVPKPPKPTPIGCFWMFARYPLGYLVTIGIICWLNLLGLFDEWSDSAQGFGILLALGISPAVHGLVMKRLKKK